MHDELPAAIALGSVGFNIVRAVDPTFGGIIVTFFGSGVTFLLNAVSFFGIVVVLKGRKRLQKIRFVKNK